MSELNGPDCHRTEENLDRNFSFDFHRAMHNRNGHFPCASVCVRIRHKVVDR